MYPDRALGFFSLPSFSLPSIDWGGLLKTTTNVALEAAKIKSQVDMAKLRAQQEQQAQLDMQRAAAAEAGMLRAPAIAPVVQWTGGAAPAVIPQGRDLLTQPWVIPAALAAAGVAVLLIATSRK